MVCVCIRELTPHPRVKNTRYQGRCEVWGKQELRLLSLWLTFESHVPRFNHTSLTLCLRRRVTRHRHHPQSRVSILQKWFMRDTFHIVSKRKMWIKVEKVKKKKNWGYFPLSWNDLTWKNNTTCKIVCEAQWWGTSHLRRCEMFDWLTSRDVLETRLISLQLNWSCDKTGLF